MNNKAQGANQLADRQLVSYQIIGLNYMMQSCLQTKQSDSDQDEVKIVVLEISSNSFIKPSNIAGRKAVTGSANQNLQNSFLKSELNIMPGERREIRVIQHDTNDTTTGVKPEYMASGLAFSKDLHHRNNSNDCYVLRAYSDFDSTVCGAPFWHPTPEGCWVHFQAPGQILGGGRTRAPGQQGNPSPKGKEVIPEHWSASNIE